MKIYQTNAGLGYNELAYLIRLCKTQNGYNYLCIGIKNVDDNPMYVIGETVNNLNDFYLEETTYKLTDSPLYGTYLFNYWLLINHYGFNDSF